MHIWYVNRVVNFASLSSIVFYVKQLSSVYCFSETHFTLEYDKIMWHLIQQSSNLATKLKLVKSFKKIGKILTGKKYTHGKVSF